MVSTTLGDRIEQARRAKGFDLPQLGRRIAVKTKTLQNWESDRSEPRPEKLTKLAGLLDVPLIWLLTGETPEASRPIVSHAGTVAISRKLERAVAMQQEGDTAADALLVAIGDQAEGFSELSMPTADLRELKQYTASICIDRSTGNAVATCPRGHRITFWRASRGEYVGAVRIPDAAGVCMDEDSGEFVVTSGRGMVHRFNAATFEERTDKAVRIAGLSWDNHLTAAYA